MENPDGTISVPGVGQVSIRCLATAFLALVLREVMAWFLAHRAQDYKNIEIIWEINLGIPARSYDESNLKVAFRRAMVAAWAVMMKQEPVTAKSVERACEAVSHLYSASASLGAEESERMLGIDPNSIAVRPEIVAEVLGYVKSPLRNDGLHLLVDVGASTLDVSTFRLHVLEGEDQYSIFTSEVAQLGAFRLHRNRLKDQGVDLSVLDRMEANLEGEGPLPVLSEYVPALNVAKVQQADTEFKDRCQNMIATVLCTTKRNRDTTASEWKTGLPVFLCGGGARIEFYKRAVKAVADQVQPSGINRLAQKPIPKPDNLDAPDCLPEDYDRLAVAYGLSFSSMEVGSVSVPSQIDDMPPLHQLHNSLDDRYVSKDMT
jgi:hypothetical protein